MLITKITKAPELVALLDADPVYAKRYARCLLDIRRCKTVEALKRCRSMGNLKRGYGKEWTSHHGMLQRAAENSIPLSSELRHFPTFLAHVGPKPHYEEARKLSIDKTNSKGYLIGHIRWEAPDQQTHNRTNSKFHLYQRRYYTDKQLAVLLTRLGEKPVKAETVKKRRLRGKTTAQQFAIEGVVYDSGLDPVSSWDFPVDCASKMNVLYRKYHRRGETRLDFFIRWIQYTELPRLDSLSLERGITSEQAADIRSLHRRYTYSMSDAVRERIDRHRQNIDYEIADSIFDTSTSITETATC